MSTESSTSEFVIKSSQVRVGVFVRIPLPWRDHPFLTSSFLITSDAQAREVAALGLDIFCDPARSKVVPAPVAQAPVVPDPAKAAEREAESKQLQHQRETKQAAKQGRVKAMDAMRARLDAVQKSYINASEQTATAFQNLAASKTESMQSIIQVAEDSALSLLADPNSTVMIVSNKAGQRGEVAHAMSVMTLSLLLAKQLKAPGAVIRAVGAGALLHDAGLFGMNRSLVRNPSRNKYEEITYQMHSQIGYDELSTAGSIVTPQVLDVVLRHHYHNDGTGYPELKAGDTVSLAAKIVSIADRFDELANPIDQSRAMSPFEALAAMWSRERAWFNDTMLQNFIRVLGLYPPGTLVQLSDGRIGVVIAAAPEEKRMAPQVLVYEKDVPRREALIVDLANLEQQEDVDLKVTKTLRAQDRNSDELDYLLPRRKISWFRANP